MRGARQREQEEKDKQRKAEEIRKRQHERAIRDAIQQISTTLNETDEQPMRHITRTVELLGYEWALTLLADVAHIEANGGMMLSDGTRRRTVGGVFFYLLKQRLKEQNRNADVKAIFK